MTSFKQFLALEAVAARIRVEAKVRRCTNSSLKLTKQQSQSIYHREGTLLGEEESFCLAAARSKFTLKMTFPWPFVKFKKRETARRRRPGRRAIERATKLEKRAFLDDTEVAFIGPLFFPIYPPELQKIEIPFPFINLVNHSSLKNMAPVQTVVVRSILVRKPHCQHLFRVAVLL